MSLWRAHRRHLRHIGIYQEIDVIAKPLQGRRFVIDRGSREHVYINDRRRGCGVIYHSPVESGWLCSKSNCFHGNCRKDSYPILPLFPSGFGGLLCNLLTVLRREFVRPRLAALQSAEAPSVTAFTSFSGGGSGLSICPVAISIVS